LREARVVAKSVKVEEMKNHRHFPKDQDWGPGLGEINHYQLLAAVAFLGRALPLCCENISPPAVSSLACPEGIDVSVHRAREFLGLVIQGVQS
jgi:hypothetical protein